MQGLPLCWPRPPPADGPANCPVGSRSPRHSAASGPALPARSCAASPLLGVCTLAHALGARKRRASAPPRLWSPCLFSFFFLPSPPATAGHLCVGTIHTALRLLSDIFTHRAAHTHPRCSHSALHKRDFTNSLLSVWPLCLHSTSRDVPPIVRVHQNPARHRPTQGCGLPSAASLPEGSVHTPLPAGARAPWGRALSRGPRVSRLRTQLRDVFQSRATAHTCSSPTRGHRGPTVPPAADVTSLSRRSGRDAESPPPGSASPHAADGASEHLCPVMRSLCRPVSVHAFFFKFYIYV